MTINAAAWLDIDQDGNTTAASGADTLFQGASMMKTLTCWMARRYLPMDRMLTAIEADYYEFGIVREGDAISVGDLIHLAMMVSDNWAADTLARGIGQHLLDTQGGTGTDMDRYCQQATSDAATLLGWSGHVIVSPSGLGTGNRFSARQIVGLLARIRTEYPWLFTVMGKLTHTVTITGGRNTTWGISHSVGTATRELLPEFRAGKTGTVANWNAYLVWSWQHPDGTIHTAAIMDTRPANRYADARALMDDVIDHPGPLPPTPGELVPLPKGIVTGTWVKVGGKLRVITTSQVLVGGELRLLS
ncbi:serine hydrolase [Micrococcus terreus]|uniref:serine hydrolase n=1 Tax=Micrococcus terreus TaxID=574650 RepID=UPI003D7406AA